MFLQTYSGRAVDPLAPRVDDIDRRDIARALSLQCRFGGHIRRFYSVAQHSFLVSQAVPAADALWGLLHDASEAYLMDLPTPVKETGPLRGYRGVEAQLQRTIYQAFGLRGQEPASIREADLGLLLLEVDALHPSPAAFAAHRGQVPIPAVTVEPWRTPAIAEAAFLQRLDELLREA
ncbi:MAG: phosphohydrolase [Vicinamibacterales bacterium]